jgi:DNA invertase Pin-like site-specific DNA recombinase
MKKQKVIEMYEQGVSVPEICSELKVFNSYVYAIIKEYKLKERLKELERLQNVS